jgi:hypothetical protein
MNWAIFWATFSHTHLVTLIVIMFSLVWLLCIESLSELKTFVFLEGLKNGMFYGAALQLCPDLKTIPYDFDGYQVPILGIAISDKIFGQI